MSLAVRPAVETDQDTIKSLVRAARVNPRNLNWNRLLVAEEGAHCRGLAGQDPPGRHTRGGFGDGQP